MKVNLLSFLLPVNQHQGPIEVLCVAHATRFPVMKGLSGRPLPSHNLACNLRLETG